MTAVPVNVCTKGAAGKELFIKCGGVKGGVSQKSFRIEKRMGSKEILEGGDEQPCVMDRFVLIWGIGFLIHRDFRMFVKEIFIVEADMPDNPYAVCDDAKFIGIAKMAVNVKLLNIRIGGGMRRHGAVSGFIRVIAIIKMHGFRISFELPDDPIGVFGVVFCNPGLYAGGIKDSHGSLGGINGLADWFGKVNKAVENGSDVIQEVLLETSNFRSIGNLVKAAEFAEMA